MRRPREREPQWRAQPLLNYLNASASYTEGDGAVTLDIFIDVHDAEGNVASASVEITSGFASGEACDMLYAWIVEGVPE